MIPGGRGNCRGDFSDVGSPDWKGRGMICKRVLGADLKFQQENGRCCGSRKARVYFSQKWGRLRGFGKSGPPKPAKVSFVSTST